MIFALGHYLLSVGAGCSDFPPSPSFEANYATSSVLRARSFSLRWLAPLVYFSFIVAPLHGRRHG